MSEMNWERWFGYDADENEESCDYDLAEYFVHDKLFCFECPLMLEGYERGYIAIFWRVNPWETGKISDNPFTNPLILLGDD